MPKLIEVDSEKCVSCGACVTLCPVEAITIDEDLIRGFQQGKVHRQHVQRLRGRLPSQSDKVGEAEQLGTRSNKRAENRTGKGQ